MNSFKETQRMWYLGLIATLPFLLIQFISYSDKNKDYFKIIFIGISLLMLLLIIALYCTKLEIEIVQNQVKYRFFPFHPNFKVLKIENIKSIQMANFDLLDKFGGIGIGKRSKDGIVSYTTFSGDGFLIELFDGKKFFFGINDVQKCKDPVEEFRKEISDQSLITIN